jgi:hypothetical protein
MGDYEKAGARLPHVAGNDRVNSARARLERFFKRELADLASGRVT